MPCQTLAALQSPGQLARTFQALRRPRQRPASFAFQAHNEHIQYADAPAASPPVLLLEPRRPLLHQLRNPGPDAPAFRSGRPVTGLLLWIAGRLQGSRRFARGLFRRPAAFRRQPPPCPWRSKGGSPS